MKYRGLKKVATHTMLTSATMNLKKLATWQWKTKNSMAFYFKFIQKLTKIHCEKRTLMIDSGVSFGTNPVSLWSILILTKRRSFKMAHRGHP